MASFMLSLVVGHRGSKLHKCSPGGSKSIDNAQVVLGPAGGTLGIHPLEPEVMDNSLLTLPLYQAQKPALLPHRRHYCSHPSTVYHTVDIIDCSIGLS